MTALATPRHRVTVATARMREVADSVADTSVRSMDADETAATLVELTRLRAQVEELAARVAAHADDLQVGSAVAASSTANWLAHQTKSTRALAHATVRLGHDLERYASTRAALAAGDIHPDQARVITQAIDQLPDGLGAGLLAKAESHLLSEARHHDAKPLRILGRRLLEVIAPDEADAHEARLLAREEATAANACRLAMHDDGHGQTHGRFVLPTFHAGALRKMLTALAAPRHLAATQGPGLTRRPSPEAMGQALCELITCYPARKLPHTGGINATLLVLIDEDSLMGRLEKAGVLDTGDKISPGLARRLACEAGIIPAVLGGDSQPLDLGRTRRLHTGYQRIALFLRDRCCRADGCDRTQGLHTHHRKRWTDGGTTDLAHGVLLCPWHHHRAHDTRCQTTYHLNGDVTFHMRQ